MGTFSFGELTRKVGDASLREDVGQQVKKEGGISDAKKDRVNC